MRRVVATIVVGSAIAVAGPAAAGPAIRGRVLDQRGQPIRGATVSIDARRTTTDARGDYAFAEAPLGAGVVVIADGYVAGVATAAEHVDDIVLGDLAGETITVSGEPPPAAPGAGKLARADLERMPGAGNDAMRALAAMPGVVSFALPLSVAGLAIRGSSPQDSKIFVDDFEVPMLYHDLGFRSIVPAEAIESLEYIPGGFDVGFGRGTSGIVRLTTRAGGATQQQAELASLDGSVIAQGTFARGSYLIALRRSVIDQLLPALLPDDLDLSLTTVPRYYDEQLRIDYAPSSAWSLRLSSLGSDDAFELYTSSTAAPDKRVYDRRRFVRVTAAATYHDDGWIAHLALSGIAQQMVLEQGEFQRRAFSSPGATARAEVTRTVGAAAGLGDVVVRVGGEAAVSRSTIDVAQAPERREGEPPPIDDPMDTSQRFSGAIWTPDFAAWTQAAASLGPRVRLSGGLRLDAFERIHELAIQPRGELAITLSPTVTARLSAGAYSRPPEYQTELLAPALAPERATQLIAGVSVQPRAELRVQASLYATDRSHLITRVGDQLANTGTGTTYGAELLATLHSGPWLGWLSYAYSHSTRVDMPGAPSRLFDYDQPHSLNAAVSYRFEHWQVGGRFRLYSGLPQTPITGAVFDSDRNLYYPMYGAVNSERAPLQHQLDLRVDRYWRWGPVKMSEFIDVQNVYLHNAPIGYLYSFDYQQRAAFNPLPIVVSTGMRGEF